MRSGKVHFQGKCQWDIPMPPHHVGTFYSKHEQKPSAHLECCLHGKQEGEDRLRLFNQEVAFRVFVSLLEAPTPRSAQAHTRRLPKHKSLTRNKKRKKNYIHTHTHIYTYPTASLKCEVKAHTLQLQSLNSVSWGRHRWTQVRL